jgi:pimeloyl-ACP methyl ester carboxylesterase
MICVFTGFPMFNKPPSPGLLDIAAELRKRHKTTNVLDFTWDQTPQDGDFDPANEPVLLIGHSFGGCSAVMMSRHLNDSDRPVHLLLLDPVRHQRDDRLYPIPKNNDSLAQIGGAQFDPGPNWVSALAFLRTDATWIPPYHQGLGKNAADTNMQVPHTDHNTIILAPVVQNMIFAKAASLFE